MIASEIAKVLDEIAPPNLAYKGEEIGFIEGSSGKRVKILGVTERPTIKVLEEAVRKKVDMLITHEPLYHSEKSTLIEKSLLTFMPNKKRKELIKKGDVVVFRYHSQWDETSGGNNDALTEKLGIKVADKIPYGRIGLIESIKLRDFADLVKKKLGNDGVLLVGDGEQKIKRVAVIAGSGNAMTEMIDYVKQKEVDVLVSGDIQDGRARYAEEIGLAVIDAGDYFTENPGAKHLADILRKKLEEITVIFFDPGPAWNVL